MDIHVHLTKEIRRHEANNIQTTGTKYSTVGTKGKYTLVTKPSTQKTGVLEEKY